jgi:hypothetical protein
MGNQLQCSTRLCLLCFQAEILLALQKLVQEKLLPLYYQ